MTNWYQAQYEGADTGDNPFAVHKAPSTPSLQQHLAAGGSITTFRRPEKLVSWDECISQPNALI